MVYWNRYEVGRLRTARGFSGITVSHQVFVKPKTERLRISSHLKVAKR